MGVMFFIKPKFEELDAANKELDDRVLVLEEKKKEIEADEGLEDRVKEAYKNVTNIANNFYDKLTTDEVSTTIDTILDEVKITNDSLSISQYGSATLDYINGTPIQAQTEVDIIANQDIAGAGIEVEGEVVSEEASKDGPVTVPAYSVDFGYSCKLEDLQKLMENLRSNNQKSLVITKCTIDDVNEDTITGEISMVLMMMPRMQDPLKKNAQAGVNSGAATDTSSAAESAAS